MTLTAARRKKLPDSAFAYPKQRKYPLDTLRRARNALSRAGQRNTFGNYGHVARAVARKWGAAVASVVPKAKRKGITRRGRAPSRPTRRRRR
jgi:hypothetical protein